MYIPVSRGRNYICHHLISEQITETLFYFTSNQCKLNACKMGGMVGTVVSPQNAGVWTVCCVHGQHDRQIKHKFS